MNFKDFVVECCGVLDFSELTPKEKINCYEAFITYTEQEKAKQVFYIATCVESLDHRDHQVKFFPTIEEGTKYQDQREEKYGEGMYFDDPQLTTFHVIDGILVPEEGFAELDI